MNYKESYTQGRRRNAVFSRENAVGIKKRRSNLPGLIVSVEAVLCRFYRMRVATMQEVSQDAGW